MANWLKKLHELPDEPVTIKTTKPVNPNDPIMGMEIQAGEDVDLWNRKQCYSCNDWLTDRCNNATLTNRDAYGNKMFLRPDPELWLRCEHHSLNKSG